MTDKEIKTAVKYAESWLNTGRECYEGYALERHATQYAKYVIALAQDLAALKEKYRWRNVDEEEPPRETEVLICCVSRSGAHKYVYTASFDGEDFYDRRGDSPSGEVKYWRPLDLPEMRETK